MNCKLTPIDDLFTNLETPTLDQNDSSELRLPYDGHGEYTSPYGDIYPAKKYSNVLTNLASSILIMELAERICFYGILGYIRI